MPNHAFVNEFIRKNSFELNPELLVLAPNIDSQKKLVEILTFAAEHSIMHIRVSKMKEIHFGADAKDIYSKLKLTTIILEGTSKGLLKKY